MPGEDKKLTLSALESIVKATLDDCIAQKTKIGDMEPSDLEVLLNDDDDLMSVYGCGNTNNAPRHRSMCIGYPSSPLYKDFSKMLNNWLQTSLIPTSDLPDFEFFEDKEYSTEFKFVEKEVLELLGGLDSLWTLWNKEEKMFRIKTILTCLKKRGVMSLLGIRKTCGSVDEWPPSLSKLIKSFNEPTAKGSALSEGARAVSKHFIRDNTLQFWGQCRGNDLQKTKVAHEKLIELVDTAVWINIHELPGHLAVIEIRQENGYGARWLADGSSFRGLLEPHMVDGHTVGWKH